MRRPLGTGAVVGRAVMGIRGIRWAGPVILTMLFVCAQPAMAAMKIASATIAIPEDDKPVLLAGLEYGAEWYVTFTSVRLQRDPKESADPVRPVWVFSATSSRPMLQKVIVEIHLLDETGNKIMATKQFVVVKSNTKDQEIPIKTKLKRADWERAKRVRIKVTFTVL